MSELNTNDYTSGITNVSTSEPEITEPAKTVMDIEIDNLKKQVAILESKVIEYQDANRKLFAHAVGATVEEPEPAKPAFDLNAAADAFYSVLGIDTKR